MYYIVYKITNLINQKFYIGCHKTSNVNDDYMGSGKLIKNAIKKYGIENFQKDILFIFDNKEDMFNKEKELVTEELVLNRNCYNVKLGGTANYYYINHNGLNHKNNQHLILKNKLESDEEYKKEFIDKMIKINNENGLKRRGISPKNKNKIAIYKDNKQKYIFESELNEYKDNGWIRYKDLEYEYICDNCGKQFKTKRKKDNNKKHFCSHSCQCSYNNKHRIYRAVV